MEPLKKKTKGLENDINAILNKVLCIEGFKASSVEVQNINNYQMKCTGPCVLDSRFKRSNDQKKKEIRGH